MIFKYFNVLSLRTNTVTKIFTRNYNPRRALMYVPGDSLPKINKSFGMDVDSIAMDIEDGVAINRKVAARETIRSVLDKGKSNTSRKLFECGVRVNSIDSGLCSDDLEAVLTAQNLPDTLLLPKVEHIDHIHWLSAELKKHMKEDQKVNLIFYIETAMGLVNSPEICKVAQEYSGQNHFIPVGVVFGSDDLCASIGALRTESSAEIMYARQKLLLVAKAFRLQAIDMVYINYKDLDGLQRQCEEGARLGYTGKQVIHPSQVPVVQRAFLPTSAQLQWARALVQAFHDHQQTGKGAFSYKGTMIDMPTVKQAQNIINLIKLIN